MTDRRESHPTVGTAHPPRNTWDGAVMYFVVLASLLSILAALLFVAPKAFAQDPDRTWVRQSVRSSCQWWENCRYHYRYYRKPRHIEIRNVYRERDDRHSRVPSFCPDKYVTRAGEERYGRERAKEAAAQAWSEEVRNQCGVLWMGVGNSRDGTYECVESATGNRKSEQTAGAAGQVLIQCVIRAKPGRARLEPVSRE